MRWFQGLFHVWYYYEVELNQDWLRYLSEKVSEKQKSGKQLPDKNVGDLAQKAPLA